MTPHPAGQMDVLAQLTRALQGRYQIERELGRGGMALVFLARDLKHDRLVAVKALRPEVGAAIGSERFVREVQIEAQLQHPHIVPLYDSGDADGLPYYVMAYVEGESLRERLSRETQLPLADAVRIACDVAEALGHAHSLGIVHRDIKPENILLSGGHALVADFGVARALSAAAGDLTGSGLVVGTAAYMSPEQAGGQDVDGRSDLYALGCVLYEMLTGGSPFAGPTPQAVLARHMHETMPSIRIVRETVPESIESVVRTLLAKTPADRYPTATQVIDALTQAPETGTRRPSRRRRPLMAPALGVALLGIVVTGWLLWSRSAPDPLAYAVLPFDPRPDAEPAALSGVQVQWGLVDALRDWEQVTACDPIVLMDAARRLGDAPPGHGHWLRIARDLGFGTMVRGEFEKYGDSVSLRATAYRTRSGRVVASATARFRPSTDDVRRTFSALAAQLLGLGPPGATAGAAGTRSLEAGRAFAEGRQAVAEGDLELAEGRFLEATRADPAFGDAQFWLAQTRAWQDRALDAWAHAAQRAMDAAGSLADPEARAFAPALLDLARGRFAEACGRYARALTADSTDFLAWLGLGECHFRDAGVVPDAASPSRWSFRSSFHTAAQAYRRGLAIAPFLSGAVMTRLRKILVVEPGRLRQGRAPDSSVFQAYPALAGDTLALVPYPRSDVRSGVVELPPTYEAALTRNRAVLNEIVTGWAEAYPRSAAALAAAAATLEEFGRSGQGAVALTQALAVVRRARELRPGGLQPVWLAHTEVRLLVKLGEFAAARDLADSVVRAERDPDPVAAHVLAALAALIGQPDRAAALLARGVPALARVPRGAEFGEVPVPLLTARERLRAYAALGAPLDSLRAVATAVATWADDPAGGRRAALLEEPLVIAFPLLGPRPDVHRSDAPNYLARLQALLADNQVARVRAGLDSVLVLRRGRPPQDLAMGVFYQETWLRLQVGDTSAAVAALDRMFADLPALSKNVLSDVVDAAALVRGMALRAELGGDEGGRPWAAAVLELWSRAAPELAPVTRTMRSIAS